MNQIESSKPRVRTDCAFLKIRESGRGGQICIALTELLCKKRDCPFYKTFEQERDELYKTKMNRKGRLKK